MHRKIVITPGIVALASLTMALLAPTAEAAKLRVMAMGLGSGTVTSNNVGEQIGCSNSCEATIGDSVVFELTATPDGDSKFVGWVGDIGDCQPTDNPCTMSVPVMKSIRAVFELDDPIPPLLDPDGDGYTPEEIADYLADNEEVVNTPARFLSALPKPFKENWILMSRSESLQTGTASHPRILLPNPNSTAVFSIGVLSHDSYPGSHPNAIEYMQWDGREDHKNFRFHEIVVDRIPKMGDFDPRDPGVAIDDAKCFRCHSTNNVFNPTPDDTHGTGSAQQAKSKPNWDTYDNWGGMISFNRDRLYVDSLGRTAFQNLLNFWTWKDDQETRRIMEQLHLQPPPESAACTDESECPDMLCDGDGNCTDTPRSIWRRQGGGDDDSAIVIPVDEMDLTKFDSFKGEVKTSYMFDGGKVAGDTETNVNEGGFFVTMNHVSEPGGDQGRGVYLFDNISELNGTRIGDELVRHNVATGNFPIDVKKLAYAILKGCLKFENTTSDKIVANTADGTFHLGSDGDEDSEADDFKAWFDARNGMTARELVEDTTWRQDSMPRRKADNQALNINRANDPYVYRPNDEPFDEAFGVARTHVGAPLDIEELRKEVFRRTQDDGQPDNTVMGGVLVDREDSDEELITFLRYFLEPLGVSVEKWSTAIRGRARTYTFADVFSTRVRQKILDELEANIEGQMTCEQIIPQVNAQFQNLSSLPAVDGVPTYTEIQRIWNRACVECHGGEYYPPVLNHRRAQFNLSEEEEPVNDKGNSRLARSHGVAFDKVGGNLLNSSFYRRITQHLDGDPDDFDEDCPFGVMPCGGPPLSQVDIESIRRWIVGDNENGDRAYTEGDPHLTTIDGHHYDFQSAGEFVLMRDMNFEVQTRQAPVETGGPLGADDHSGLAACVSLNTAVAFRVGDHRVSYQPEAAGSGSTDGFFEDFEDGNSQGWTLVAQDSTATTGDWSIGTPDGTTIAGQPAQPAEAATGFGCAFTAANPGGIGSDDVDGGVVYLVSPTIDLSGLASADFSYSRWFYNRDLGEDSGDFYTVDVSDDDGATWTNVETLGSNDRVNSWTPVSVKLDDHIALTDQVRLRFGASDGSARGNIIEGGVDDISIEGRSSRLQLRVDGQEVNLGPEGINLAGGGRILQTNAPDGIQVIAPSGTEVVVTPNFWNFRQLWYMNVNFRHARGTQGLVGPIHPGQWLPALPDGTYLGPRPEGLGDRYTQLYQEFADAWRVTDDNSLFDYAAGTSTDTFTDLDWPGFQELDCSREGIEVQEPLPPEAAEQACANLVNEKRKENCEIDVMAMGDVTFAETYELTENIASNQVPTSPQSIAPEQFALDVDTTVEFSWTAATDPDPGDEELTYKHCLWLSENTRTPADCEIVAGDGLSITVSGLQPAQDYSWFVMVEDNNNGRAFSETRRFDTRTLSHDWRPWVTYAEGDRVFYNGIEYVCIQGHTSQPDWQPDITPALWERVIVSDAWQPQTAYETGAMVTYQGSEYECRQGHTSQVGWEPPNVPALWLKH